MRKEYTPAILIYIASAILFVVSAVLFFINSYHWATFLLLGIALLLGASSLLVKIGNKLRDE